MTWSNFKTKRYVSRASFTISVLRESWSGPIIWESLQSSVPSYRLLLKTTTIMPRLLGSFWIESIIHLYSVLYQMQTHNIVLDSCSISIFFFFFFRGWYVFDYFPYYLIMTCRSFFLAFMELFPQTIRIISWRSTLSSSYSPSWTHFSWSNESLDGWACGYLDSFHSVVYMGSRGMEWWLFMIVHDCQWWWLGLCEFAWLGSTTSSCLSSS